MDTSMGNRPLLVAVSSVKALRCDGCGAVLATTESPPDLHKWARRTFRWTRIGARNFCDSCF
jgi:hypothetical protein